MIAPRRWRGLLPLVLLLAGCGLTGPDGEFEYVLGDLFCCAGESAEVEFGGTGDTLTLQITTWGDSCEAKGTLWFDVDRENLRVVVAPMDLRPVDIADPSACGGADQRFEHQGTIVLGEGGWGINIRGVDGRDDEEPVVTLTGFARIR